MHDLVVFSHVRWDFVHGRQQQLLSRMARDRRVFFVEAPERRAGTAGIGTRSPCAGVTLLRAFTPFEATGFSDAQLAIVGPLLDQRLAEYGVREAVAWFCTPMALPLLKAVPALAVVYDCVDEASAFDIARPQRLQRETELLRLADLILTPGPALHAALQPRSDCVHCFPNAVDAAHFRPSAEHVDDHEIPHPRLGYVGAIDESVDLDLIAALAQAQPQWQIVMAGPVVGIDASTLPRAANVHWLGTQPYDTLPGLVQGWQVCLLPLALNTATRFVSPTQTLEYMAAEKPVVSTAVQDVVTLHGEQIPVAEDAEGFIALCRAALAEDATQRLIRIASARAVVARSSWDDTVDAVRRLVDDAAGGETASARSPQAARDLE